MQQRAAVASPRRQQARHGTGVCASPSPRAEVQWRMLACRMRALALGTPEGLGFAGVSGQGSAHHLLLLRALTAEENPTGTPTEIQQGDWKEGRSDAQYKKFVALLDPPPKKKKNQIAAKIPQGQLATREMRRQKEGSAHKRSGSGSLVTASWPPGPHHLFHA